MQNYDYVILFDENGQPYIEHSLWSNAKSWGKKASGRVRSAGRTAHKYLMKVGEGARARYAYTKEEVDALMGRGKKAVSNAASNARNKVREVSGANARDRMRAAEKAKRSAHAVNTKDYNDYRKTVRNELAANNKANAARLGAMDANAYFENAKNAALNANKKSYAASQNEQNAAEAAKKAREEHAASRSNYDRSVRDLETAEKEYSEKYDKYYGDENNVGKTIGRALSSSERESHAADKEDMNLADAYRKQAYQDKNKARESQEAASRKQHEADEAHREAYDNKQKAKEAADRATEDMRRAASEKRIADKESRQAEIDESYARTKRRDANLKVLESDVKSMQSTIDYNLAKHEYANTPLGKLDSLVKNVKDTSKTVKDYASEKIDDLKSSADEMKERAKASANYAKQNVSDSVNRVKDTIESARRKIEKESNDRQAAKEIKKAADAFDKWKDKNVRPADGIFTLSKATGETVKKNMMYDFYMDQIYDKYDAIAANPNMDARERAKMISDANNLMYLAEQYAEKKR